jgi:hypothetical protein
MYKYTMVYRKMQHMLFCHEGIYLSSKVGVGTDMNVGLLKVTTVINVHWAIPLNKSALQMLLVHLSRVCLAPIPGSNIV